jgi:hypothetical protein
MTPNEINGYCARCWHPLAACKCAASPVMQNGPEGETLAGMKIVEDASIPAGEVRAVWPAPAPISDEPSWLKGSAIPVDFSAYIARNYSGEVFFSSPEWHAKKIWQAAMYSVRRLLAEAAPAAEPAIVEAAKKVTHTRANLGWCRETDDAIEALRRALGEADHG